MQQRLDALDPFARDLEVGFLGPQPFTLRVQAHHGADERLGVGKPTLGVAGRGGQDHEHALRKAARERRHQHGRARSGKAAQREPAAGRGELLHQRAGRRQTVHPIEQEVERH